MMNTHTIGNSKWQPASPMLNEKALAEILGLTEYRVRQMRLKQGLPCITDKDQHQIYYYWPVVDEYFRAKSKPYGSDETISEVLDKDAEPDVDFSSTEPPEPVLSKQPVYKPMERV